MTYSAVPNVCEVHKPKQMNQRLQIGSRLPDKRPPIPKIESSSQATVPAPSDSHRAEDSPEVNAYCNKMSYHYNDDYREGCISFIDVRAYSALLCFLMKRHVCSIENFDSCYRLLFSKVKVCNLNFGK